MSNAPSSQAEPDYDRLLRANLEQVFNERDPARRDAAIAELYSAEPILYEPDAVITGREAISAVVGKLQAQFGPDFRFVPAGPGIGHHAMGLLHWHGGTPENAEAVSGADTAEIVKGRIMKLWVMLTVPAN